MKKSSSIKLTNKIASGLSLDDYQKSNLLLMLEKNLPSVLAENSNELSVMLYQQEPRHDKIAEAGLIGRMLSLPNIVLPECTGITPDYFYISEYKEVFKVIKKLEAQSKAIDTDVVAAYLGENMLNEMGGRVWLDRLTQGIKEGDAYIPLRDRIIESYKLRRAWKMSSNFLEKTYKIDLEDTDEFIAKFKDSLDVDDNVNDSLCGGGGLANLMVEDFQNITDRIASGVLYPGLIGPIKDINDFTGGKRGGDLIIEAARPGMGKTAYAIREFLDVVLDQKKTAVFFSLEMSKVRILRRMFGSRYMVKKTDYEKGLDDRKIQQLNDFVLELENSNAFIDDRPGVTWQYIRSKCLKAKNKTGSLAGIWVDYLQLMNATEEGSREQKISTISRKLKELAKELNAPVTALCQLSRAVETRGGSKRPQLSDLRESGAIEQDADVVMFHYRPEYYDIYEDEEGNSLRGLSECIYAKHREGELNSVRLFFNAEYTKFDSLDQRPDNYMSPSHRKKLEGDFNWGEFQGNLNDDSFFPEIPSTGETSFTDKMNNSNDNVVSDDDVPF
jgi:replicative DNA helicase